MKLILDVLKGAAVGLGNVVAGLSGGTVAVLLNIYERLIGDISNIFKDFKKSVKSLLPIVVGMLIGIVLGIVVIKRVYETFPIVTSLFFCGLVISSVPFLYKKISKVKFNVWHIIIFVLFFALIIYLPFLTSGSEHTLDTSFVGLITAFLLGFIAAVAMIIPGVSGSMITLALGYYDNILTLGDNVLHGQNLQTNLVIVLAFGVGAIVALICAAKLIKYLLSHFFSYSYAGIIALVAASSVAIIISCVKSEYFVTSNHPLNWVIGVVFFIIGIVLGYAMTKLEGKKTRKEEIHD